MSRITPCCADDLDDLLAPGSPRATSSGAVVFPEIEAPLRPQVPFRRPDTICVGFRLGQRERPAVDRAVRFAAMALERDVEVVVLADDDVCGLEQFGFRIERIAGEGECGRACIDQLLRFWALDLLLEA
jgi:hypothetical protein